MKEKIGMEKLIELLNEFLEEKYPKKNLVKAIEDDYFVNNWNDGDGFLCETIMSKKFGFIKWLVENDKINIEKIENSEYYLIDWFYYNERKKFGIEWLDDVEKILLMLLSISDTPIEDLISYLK